MQLISYIESFKKVSESRLNDHLIFWAKTERKGKSKTEIKEQGLNIYNVSDVESLIDTALERGELLVLDITEADRTFSLSDDGKLSLAIFLTDNFCDAYKAYSIEVDAFTEETKQLPLSKMTIMKYFYRGHSINMLKENLALANSSNTISIAYHHHLISNFYGITSLEKDACTFHFAPRLYVPPEWIGRKVTIEIEGLDEPVKLVVTSPYPNKRYYVAGVKLGRLNTANGFYPVIKPRDSFPAHKELLLRWKLDDEIRIDHHLKLNFKFTNSQGRFFSSEQQLLPDVAGMKKFTLTTTIDHSTLSERNARVIVHDIFNHYEIHEDATLVNFPMELHHSVKATSYFSKWYKSWTAEKELI
ncbi:hypothetical protein YDYSY3_39220 [Paenibacillus chitinolyticus]|nr:hypothetical protein YDYSY3_39220 [Paenibacillus chitinolyticus]